MLEIKAGRLANLEQGLHPMKIQTILICTLILVFYSYNKGKENRYSDDHWCNLEVKHDAGSTVDKNTEFANVFLGKAIQGK